jgi:hypothetical protein
MQTVERPDTPMNDIICISHLRWNVIRDSARQLPWRLMSKCRVTFVEPPVIARDIATPRLEILDVTEAKQSEVTVLRLHYSASASEATSHGNPIIQPIYNRFLKAYLKKEHYQTPILWLYSSEGLGFTNVIDYRLLIYDVIDCHNSNGRASVEMLQSETILLRGATDSVGRKAESRGAYAQQYV